MTQTAAVLALHYQNDVLHPDGKIALGLAQQPETRAQVIAGATQMLSAARAADVPIIYVQMYFAADGADIVQNNVLFKGAYASGAMRAGSWGAEFYDGLGPQRGERVIRHNRVNAFYNTELEETLDQLGARQLYLGGIATNSVVEHTARDAADMGYDVLVVEDACASAREDLHAAALENIKLIGRTVSSDNLTF